MFGVMRPFFRPRPNCQAYNRPRSSTTTTALILLDSGPNNSSNPNNAKNFWSRIFNFWYFKRRKDTNRMLPNVIRPTHVIRRAVQIVKYGSLLAVSGSTLYVLHNNDYDLSSIGVMRVGRAIYAAARIVVDYKISLYGLVENSEHYLKTQSNVHKRSAERLLKLACANGGVWIKVGQHCGSLEYLLPSEYVRTLSVLHSKAPHSSFDEICRVIREELDNEKAYELIRSMKRKPVGAASLAQVHQAVLNDGTVVAVKVQHRRVKPNSFVDIAAMEALVRCVAVLFPDFKLMWLVEETKKNLPQELDFLNEGQNTDRVRRMFSHLHFLKVPEIHWDYSTDRVLTMEYCEGGQINDLEYIQRHNISPSQVCRYLGKLYSEMIFQQGYVHCDPHPGNVLVHKTASRGTQIVLLDHGLYTTLDEDFRLHYANLWLALLKSDLDEIKEASRKLGVGDMYGLFACMVTARSWKSVMSGIDKQNVTQEESSEIKHYIGSYLPQISEVLSRVPRPMLLIFKTNDLLRGIEYSLGVQRNAYSFVQMSKYCVAAVHDHALNRCDSFSCRFGTRWRKFVALCRITFYEFFLNLSGVFINMRVQLLRLMYSSSRR